MTPKQYLKGKKALVMGLGVFGGGTATAKWLLAQGAEVVVTDLRSEGELKASLGKFTARERKMIRFVLGRHDEKDFLWCDMVVVNPGVPSDSSYLKLARKEGKTLENEASLFFRFVESPTIGVTGTRGKSTVTSYIAELLSSDDENVHATGNNPQNAFLKAFAHAHKHPKVPVVAELSSWQLELLPKSGRAPHIAVITNLFPDHLNRYQNKIENYARAKANIYKDQTKDDFLILNHNSLWTKYFLTRKPRSQILYFSTKSLPKKKNGVFVESDAIFFQLDGAKTRVVPVGKFRKERGEHNLENLLASVLAVRLLAPSTRISERAILSLDTVPFRQEILLHSKKLTVVNDSAGTSPDATIVALKRFSVRGDVVLITGGTDKELQFGDLAKEIKQTVHPSRLVLLEGSATAQLQKELKKLGYFNKTQSNLFTSLSECVKKAFVEAKSLPNAQVVFSPAGSSFEKFKNEFDRGEQFNQLAMPYIES